MDRPQLGAERDLRDYVRVLSRRKLVIAATALLVLAAALALSFTTKSTYLATSTVLVPEQPASSALNIQATQQQQNPAALQRTLSDEQQFAEGDNVKNAAAKVLGYRAHVSIGTSSTADVLTITASSGNRMAAPQIANAYANAYISARRANQVNQYTQQVSALNASIAKLQAKANSLLPSDPQKGALQQSVGTLTQSVEQAQAASQLVDEVGPSVLKAAAPPASPASPRPIRNGVLGLVLGLLLGLGLAFLLDRFDDGIRSRDQVDRAANGIPVIALVPMVDSWTDKGSHHLALLEDPTSQVAEAYRTLRTAVQFLNIDKSKRVIGVTSSVPSEGKTTAVANLAISFARAGQKVTVISCDLRRPRLHEFFQMENRCGLTSVLLGEADLSDALQEVESDSTLRILPSGPIPPNPAEILSSSRVREVVERLSADADIVLLDCPPVLPVTDALLVSGLVDGVLVLASTKSTSSRDLTRTLELLDQVRAPVLGIILNRVPNERGYDYGYSYGYAPYTSHVGDIWQDGAPRAPEPLRDSQLVATPHGSSPRSSKGAP